MTQRAQAHVSTPGFFSLKWKALLVLSLVLVAIHVSFASFQYLSLKNELLSDRRALATHNQLILEALTEQSDLRLQQIGELIPQLYGMKEALLEGKQQGLRDAFNTHWPWIQLNMNIDAAAFYDTDNHPLASWGRQFPRAKHDAALLNLVRQANENERPVSIIACDVACAQYAAIPLLVGGRHSASVLLATSMADIILNFSRISSSNVGIITFNAQHTPATLHSQRRLSQWNAYIMALTQGEQMYEVLQAAALKHTLDQIKQDSVQVIIGTKTYEVRILSMPGTTQADSVALLVIDDISQAVTDIFNATQNAIWFGILGLFLSEMVLLAVLWKPLSRLRRTALTLPLLAKSAYEQVRRSIPSRSHWTRRFDDEIDQLDASAMGLSFQLETLESEVAHRNKTLAEKMQELTRERDFVRGLLDTAQVIIITQSQDGRIQLVNRLGEQLTGYTEDDLKAKHFTDLVASDSLPHNYQQDFSDVASGLCRTLQHESTLLTRAQEPRTITWLHCHLDNAADQATSVLSVGLDITDRKEAESRLAWLANHDPLTGLFNRRRFEEEFTTAVKTAHRHNRPGALLFLDLDHLKYINDTSGHKVGDTLIKAVANELSQMHRETDIVARLGGDEFAIVMPEVGTDDACNVARKINNRLSKLVIPVVDKAHKVSASIGIALFPEHGTLVDELLANADIAMYQAKEHGRGSWHLFSEREQVRERLQERVLWKQRIEKALEEHGFTLHYQPILDLQCGTISHYEVLLRMLDNNGLLHMPGSFIEIAEQSGQIHAIDHWVLEYAIISLKRHISQGNQVTFAVNLSAYALADNELVPRLKHLIDTHNIPAQQLVFEITETAALSDFAAACKMMEQIRAMGCKFALDDFGVGFSSFYYLKQLPVDYIKIDGSFIKDLSHNRDDQILVRAMAEIARGFGKKTIAEFVEDNATLQLLQKYHINYAQGFHIGRPAPFNELTAKHGVNA